MGRSMGSSRRVVTVPEQTKEGFLEEVPLKDEGTPGREYYEQRPEDGRSEMAGKVKHWEEPGEMTPGPGHEGPWIPG